ncbi:MAG: hypothetical protein ACREA0_28105 [bacterium]
MPTILRVHAWGEEALSLVGVCAANPASARPNLDVTLFADNVFGRRRYPAVPVLQLAPFADQTRTNECGRVR